MTKVFRSGAGYSNATAPAPASKPTRVAAPLHSADEAPSNGLRGLPLDDCPVAVAKSLVQSEYARMVADRYDVGNTVAWYVGVKVSVTVRVLPKASVVV